MHPIKKHSTSALIWFAALVVLSFTACKEKDTTLSILGTVSDSNGAAIEGAIVSPLNGSFATTDANGKYSILSEQGGILTFTAKGFSSKTIEVQNKTTIDITLELDPWIYSFSSNNNIIKDPQLPSNSLIPSVFLSTPTANDPWYSSASYAGAVASAFGSPWYDGWSFFGHLISGNTTSAPLNIAGRPILHINNTWMQKQGSSINWSADTVYVLDSLVFVTAGQTLNIAAGTIVQGQAGPSSLVVTRGAQIMAMGTANAPIIFTYEGDMGNSASTLHSQWGGLYILGNASLNTSFRERSLNGIATADARGFYGGNKDSESSGILRYVSIRHGGSILNGGLTLAGVGSGTTLKYVETIAGAGGGIQWLGGTVNAKYLISAYCKEAALDYNEGYRGKNQFVVVYQPTAPSNYGGNHKGGTAPIRGTPFSTPQFWNVTSIGNNSNQALIFADNAGGQYHNSIFMNYNKGVSIEKEARQGQDAYQQFIDGKLIIANSVFFNIGNNATAENIFSIDYAQ